MILCMVAKNEKRGVVSAPDLNFSGAIKACWLQFCCNMGPSSHFFSWSCRLLHNFSGKLQNFKLKNPSFRFLGSHLKLRESHLNFFELTAPWWLQLFPGIVWALYYTTCLFQSLSLSLTLVTNFQSTVLMHIFDVVLDGAETVFFAGKTVEEVGSKLLSWKHLL